jgi:hypothetical protein
MLKALLLVLVCASTACGGKSANAVPPVPTVSDGGTRLPPPDGMSGNPEQEPNINRSNQN